jgi:hypothetical protein
MNHYEIRILEAETEFVFYDTNPGWDKKWEEA